MFNMDIGRLNDPNVVLKRKFRWVFSIGDLGGTEHVVTYASSNKNGHICKISSRPVLSFVEQQVQHTIEIINLPGKAEWEPIKVTVYDIAGDSFMYRWLLSFYDPWYGRVSPIAEPISNLSKPKKEGNLYLLDGHGKTIERWLIEGCWPRSIDWGDLDYESSEIASITFDLRYDRAILQDVNGFAITDPLS